jgi:hypothetical protein
MFCRATVRGPARVEGATTVPLSSGFPGGTIIYSHVRFYFLPYSNAACERSCDEACRRFSAYGTGRTSSQKFASATGLKDPESGAFYRKGRASLHFHEALRASSLICAPPTNGAFSRKRGGRADASSRHDRRAALKASRKKGTQAFTTDDVRSDV